MDVPPEHLYTAPSNAVARSRALESIVSPAVPCAAARGRAREARPPVRRGTLREAARSAYSTTSLSSCPRRPGVSHLQAATEALLHDRLYGSAAPQALLPHSPEDVMGPLVSVAGS